MPRLKGFKHSPETKLKMSLAKRGWKPSIETRKKMSESGKGKKLSMESIQKRTETRKKKGYKHSLETRKKMSLASLGKKKSKEARQKMSEFRRGKKQPQWLIDKRIKRGEKAPNWKGGITPLAKRIRTLLKYRQWRSDVFTRDDFTCQECGVRGNYLEADHYPKRFSKILKDYEIRTLEEALNCEELWNINNGRTLCGECHNKVRKFGKKFINEVN